MRTFPLFALLLVSSTLPAIGQSTATPDPARSTGALASGQYQYCMLIRTANGQLDLDYGQHDIPPVTDAQLVQATKRLHTMQTVVGALNYLSARGWEFMSATTTPLEARPPDMRALSAPKSYNTTYLYEANYLLRRRIP